MNGNKPTKETNADSSWTVEVVFLVMCCTLFIVYFPDLWGWFDGWFEHTFPNMANNESDLFTKNITFYLGLGIPFWINIMKGKSRRIKALSVFALVALGIISLVLVIHEWFNLGAVMIYKSLTG